MLIELVTRCSCCGRIAASSSEIRSCSGSSAVGTSGIGGWSDFKLSVVKPKPNTEITYQSHYFASKFKPQLNQTTNQSS